MQIISYLNKISLSLCVYFSSAPEPRNHFAKQIFLDFFDKTIASWDQEVTTRARPFPLSEPKAVLKGSKFEAAAA